MDFLLVVGKKTFLSLHSHSERYQMVLISDLQLENKRIFDDKIELKIPTLMLDVSQFRQVPDNQYCWVVRTETDQGVEGDVGRDHSSNRNGYSSSLGKAFPSVVQQDAMIPSDFSLILELVEMNSCPNVSAYIDDLAESDDGPYFNPQPTPILQLHDKVIPIPLANDSQTYNASLAAKLLTLSKFNGMGAANAVQDVLVVMGLVRLARAETDILITMNLPLAHVFDNEVQRTQMINDWALRWIGIMESIIQSFRVLDWSLFC